MGRLHRGKYLCENLWVKEEGGHLLKGVYFRGLRVTLMLVEASCAVYNTYVGLLCFVVHWLLSHCVLVLRSPFTTSSCQPCWTMFVPPPPGATASLRMSPGSMPWSSHSTTDWSEGPRGKNWDLSTKQLIVSAHNVCKCHTLIAWVGDTLFVRHGIWVARVLSESRTLDIIKVLH